MQSFLSWASVSDFLTPVETQGDCGEREGGEGVGPYHGGECIFLHTRTHARSEGFKGGRRRGGHVARAGKVRIRISSL